MGTLGNSRGRYLRATIAAVGTLTAAILFSGCAGRAGDGVTVWNPFTWFSGSEGSSVARSEARRDEAAGLTGARREELLKLAQEEATKTDLALQVAPVSIPVEVAGESSGRTVVAMDEALGAIPEMKVRELQELIARLVSENEEVRAQARESERIGLEAYEAAIQRLREAQDRQAKAQAAFEAKQVELRAAFDRENALANRYRNTRFLFFGTVVLGLVGGAIVLYLRVVGMGALGSIVGGIDKLKRSNPGSPLVEDLLTSLSKSMNDRQKSAVRHLRAQAVKTEP